MDEIQNSNTNPDYFVPAKVFPSSTADAEVSQPEQEETSTEKNGSFLNRLWRGKNTTGKIISVLAIVATLSLSLVALFFLITITSIDTLFVKITLNGQVLNEANQPVTNAEIKINGYEAYTDGNGVFTISGLDVSKYLIEINADGYKGYKEEIALNRGFLNYTVDRSFTLTPSGYATINGKLIANNGTYAFIGDKLRINDIQYDIESDGSFTAEKVETGEAILNFSSINFKDEEIVFEVEDGTNILDDIKLTPAGDIVGQLVSWLTETVVNDVEILAEGVAPTNIKIEKDGSFRIQDLNTGETYKIRFQKSGYVTREYEVTIDLGENRIIGFALVEEGLVPLQRKVNNRSELFISEFDGKNIKQITSNDFQVYAEYLDGDEIFFLSTRDNIKNELGGKAYIAYVASTIDGNPQRLTADTSNLGRIIPNFSARKLINITKGDQSTHRKLEVMDLSGSRRVEIEYIEEGSFNNALISDNGKYVVYYMQDKDETINGLYRADTGGGQSSEKLLDKRNLILIDIDHTGNSILFSAYNENTNKNDLYIYAVDSNTLTTLRSGFTGSQYQFVHGSSDLLLFQDLRDSSNNVYLLDITNNSEQKITNFTSSEGIESVYQQEGLIIYQTNKGMYVSDIDKIKLGKLITSDFTRYTGYDF